mgnify:CR=1 FL=1
MQTMNKENRTANIGLAIWRLKCFYETFVQGSKAVILLNFSAKNPPHRQAEKRYGQVLKTTQHEQTNQRTTIIMVGQFIGTNSLFIIAD